MNTINHYVGMFPIATGAPVEKPLAKFFFGFFAVMLLGLRRYPEEAAPVDPARWASPPSPPGRWSTSIVLGHLASHVKAYMDEAGTFFKEPDKIKVWGDNVTLASNIVIAGLIAAMVVVVLGVWKFRSFELLLALVPALLPVFFVIEYAGWLWFFGHNMHPWGAFTVKPFMPTVFGEGKVAQFSTYSYPYWGYALLLVVFACLMLALLMRRKQLRDRTSPN